jgi:hypothetical protein
MDRLTGRADCTPQGCEHSAKTLWDWLQLLGIPGADLSGTFRRI